jgi:ribonuclease BN (tRNA processing enzyme)
MKIKILGNGGAINDGLPYNAFVINGSLLCETPPDIMLSINKNFVELSSINTIYISHLHGDHIFGLPFLIISAFFLHVGNDKKLSFIIVGPEGLEMMTENLIVSAFTSKHPCFKWMKEHCIFLEVDETSKPELVNGFQTSIFKLDHLIDTYGFSLAHEDNRVDFAYIADTRWCESVYAVLNNKPRVVLIDLNGKDNDPEPVHLSIGVLKQKAIPLTGRKTKYFGTHLKEEFNSTISCVKCAKPGMDINL